MESFTLLGRTTLWEGGQGYLIQSDGLHSEFIYRNGPWATGVRTIYPNGSRRLSRARRNGEVSLFYFDHKTFTKDGRKTVGSV